MPRRFRSISRRSRVACNWAIRSSSKALTRRSRLSAAASSARARSVWFANPADYTPGSSGVSGVNPAIPPAPVGSPPAAPLAIPIPHTSITFHWPGTTGPTDDTTHRPTYLIRYGWKDIGQLIDVQSMTVGGPTTGSAGAAQGTTDPSASSQPLQSLDNTPFPVPSGAAVLVQDVNGNGATGIVDSPDIVANRRPGPLTGAAAPDALQPARRHPRQDGARTRCSAAETPWCPGRTSPCKNRP